MIPLLLSIILNAPLNDCAKTGMIDPASIVTTVERDGTSYQYGSIDLFQTNDGELRLYRLDSPYLHPLHGYLVILVHGLTVNEESYRQYLEASVVRPVWCDLPLSRPRA